MAGGGRSGLLYGVGTAVCLGVAAWVGWRQLPQVQVGDVDPVSAVIALAALAAALWTGRQTVRALRDTQPSAEEVAARLAVEVGRRETQARVQLLGGQGRAIDVDFDFRPAPAHDAGQAAAAGTLGDVTTYYRALHPQRLVITGAPGAGKTVLALELMLGLLANRAPADPVPIRVSAAAWDTDRPVHEWLTEHLVDAYRLSPTSAETVLHAGLVLPVIDGLDEMDATPTPDYTSRAARAVQALNTYQHGRAAAPLVLTCRSGQYQSLRAIQVWTRDAARIEIRAVDSTKAEQFIRSRVDDITRWRPVVSTITHHPGGTLAVALSTPWRLTLATTVYEQRDPTTGTHLRDPAALTRSSTSPEAIRDHLLAHFIPATAGKSPYSDVEVHAWLRVLAQYLTRNADTGRTFGGAPLSGTDLVLHQLWPIGGTTRVRLVVGATLVAIWLVATPFLLAEAGIGFSPRQLLGAGFPALGVVGLVALSWTTPWPMPSHLDVRHLRTWRGFGTFLVILVVILATSLITALVLGILFGPALELPQSSFTQFGVVAGLAGGALAGLTQEATDLPWDPREFVKRDQTVGLAVGLTFGGSLGMSLGFSASPTFGTLVGLATGLTTAMAICTAGTRYLAMLLCFQRPFAKHPLPWRLGRFLHWCYQAGLVRQAGIGYQFRHRELQDYLARTPSPGT